MKSRHVYIESVYIREEKKLKISLQSIINFIHCNMILPAAIFYPNTPDSEKFAALGWEEFHKWKNTLVEEIR